MSNYSEQQTVNKMIQKLNHRWRKKNKDFVIKRYAERVTQLSKKVHNQQRVIEERTNKLQLRELDVLRLNATISNQIDEVSRRKTVTDELWAQRNSVRSLVNTLSVKYAIAKQEDIKLGEPITVYNDIIEEFFLNWQNHFEGTDLYFTPTEETMPHADPVGHEGKSSEEVLVEMIAEKDEQIKELTQENKALAEAKAAPHPPKPEPADYKEQQRLRNRIDELMDELDSERTAGKAMLNNFTELETKAQVIKDENNFLIQEHRAMSEQITKLEIEKQDLISELDKLQLTAEEQEIQAENYHTETSAALSSIKVWALNHKDPDYPDQPNMALVNVGELVAMIEEIQEGSTKLDSIMKLALEYGDEDIDDLAERILNLEKQNKQLKTSNSWLQGEYGELQGEQNEWIQDRKLYESKILKLENENKDVHTSYKRLLEDNKKWQQMYSRCKKMLATIHSVMDMGWEE